MEGSVRLTLFGGAVLEANEEPLTGPVSRRYPLAILSLLATAPSRELSRGKLVGLLWPESPETSARNRLNTYVHHIRSELGPEVVASVGDDLRLNADALACDVWRFEEALEAGDPDTAVELYRGPFLDGFHLGGSPPFEKRADRIRDRLRRAYLEALERLADRAEERGAPAVAADRWRERVGEDPYDSRVVARLMQALDSAGNRAAALRAAREHARLLEEEFGTDPDDEVADLARQLRQPSGRTGSGSPAAASVEASAVPEGRVARPDEPPGPLSPRSVAVLPFASLGGSEDAELFAVGLYDDLVTELSRLSGLTVISRTSVKRYGDGERSVPEIARELGVGTVIEGAVQSSGSRVRLNVQVVDARTDTHRWSETYDRRLTPEGLFDLQSELAGRIAGTLRSELTSDEEDRIGRTPTGSLDAYRLYVQGRGLLEQRTEDTLPRALDYFLRAVELDDRYAPAWSGVADALLILGFYGIEAPASAPDPETAARRALDVEPDLAEAHGSLGILRSLRQEGPSAAASLERAIELEPSHAEAHAWLGWLRLLLGAPEAALEPSRRAVRLNPLGPAFRAYLAESWLANGEPRRALEESRRAAELQPTYALARYMQGMALHHQGRLEGAVTAYETSLSLSRAGGSPSPSEVRAALAVTKAAAGDCSDAREQLTTITAAEEAGDSQAAFSAGLVRAALGDVDAAFEAFARVPVWNSYSTEHLRYFFPEALGALREDPRHERLLGDVDRSWGLER